MDIVKYRNWLKKLVNWEWNTLKNLRRKRKKNILLRGSFLILSLGSIIFCIFAPTFILYSLLTGIGFPFTIVKFILLISLFFWLWFITPMK